MEEAHCFVINDSALKRKNTNVDIKFTFSQIFRTLKYMTTVTEPAFLCVFRSSGGNTTEIMQKGIENYVRPCKVRQVLQVLRRNESYNRF